MFEKVELLRGRFHEVGKQLMDPAATADMKQYARLNKEYRDLEQIVSVYDDYLKTIAALESSKQLMENESDPEFREMAREEYFLLEGRKPEIEEKLKQLLIPKEPEDERNVLLEIRAGTGGDEASLFAGDLCRMYTRFGELKGWQVLIANANEGTMGGFKEVVLEIKGEDVYGTLKFESGVHRVQRIPETEAKGRVHTSAASVAVLPEAEEVEIHLNEADIKMDTFRSSGAGGQHVNKTESAVRLTHIPTGTIVECQQERSQHKNKDKAMQMLKTRIYEAAVRKHEEEIASRRKTLVSTGDRSAKIRTYNWPQGRITDHRIGMSVYNLEDFMNGNIEGMLEALMMAEQTEKMKEGGIQ